MQNQQDFIVFGAPQIEQAEIDEVIDSMQAAWLGTGSKVARFEREFANYKGLQSDHVAATNSCTAALHISMIAAGLAPGDEVITTALTFCATVNAIIHTGATPVLVDVEPGSMNMDPRAVEAAITERTRAIIPVHFAGRSCDMDALMSIARKHHLKVIEDCAHAIESEYHGQKTGTFGDFGCFSFYATKNITTGEGGMVVAQDEHDIARIKVLALHGMSKDAWHRFGDEGYKHYLVTEAGFKYNMMDIQAAIGIHQLERIERNWQKRQALWGTYQQAFAGLPVTCPEEAEADTRHAYHLYTLLIDEAHTGFSRDAFLERMTLAGVGVGVHYLSIPEHPYYQQHFGWRPEDYPHAMRVGRQTVSLPLSAKLNDSEIARTIAAVDRALHGKSRL